MAISFPLTLPASPRPRETTLTELNASAVSTSPFSYQQQAVNFGGDAWMLNLKWAPLTDDQAAPILAVLTALRGSFGTFLYQAAATTIRGSVKDHANVPVVRGAHTAGARTLNVKSARASQTGYFRAGDLIQLGAGGQPHIYKILTDANTAANGRTSLDIWPRLRGSLADGAAIKTTNPIGIWRMTGNELGYSLDHLRHYGLAIACREAL